MVRLGLVSLPGIGAGRFQIVPVGPGQACRVRTAPVPKSRMIMLDT
jgi:hypothetical protein